MKVSYNWIKEYINTSISPEKMAQILTDTGLEVENWSATSSVEGGLDHVVVGHVKEVMQHPNADRLKLTMVDVGEDELLQIVCGAPNVALDQKVVVAKVGATLYPNPDEPFKIKKSKIRGEVSMGMICAEDEIGLGESHDGIMVLPEDVEVGLPAAQYFEVENDVIFEIGLTPNRADAMGHIGVARDIKAYLNYHEDDTRLSVEWPEVEIISLKEESPIQLKIENKEACPNYQGVYIENVKVEPSPNWIKNKLTAIGLKPINNVVDITNFVLHEVGCPLHAFDGKIVDGHIIVRNAKEGEEFVTLDGQERTLSSDDLVIANEEEPMCIAGVFGGENSGVKESTTSVFLEAAYFNPVSVRKTAKRHALNTDASFRFERGIDPNKVQYALKRATQLIMDIAGGQIVSKFYNEGKAPVEPFEITFSPDQARKLIGASISNDHMESILGDLDIEVELGENKWMLKVPAYRVDVTRQADVVEEILRIYGLNKVSEPAGMKMTLVHDIYPAAHQVKQKARRVLASTGGQEVMNNTLSSSDWYEKFGVMASDSVVQLLNPLSKELDVMRQTLFFGLLQSIAYNKNRQQKVLRFYEFGKTYWLDKGFYKESEQLSFMVSGLKNDESWENSSGHKVDFFDLKSWVNTVLSAFIDVDQLEYTQGSEAVFETPVTIKYRDNSIGSIGRIKPQVCQYFDVKDEVYGATIDWSFILKVARKQYIQYKEIPKFPEVRRDFSLLISEGVKFDEIKAVANDQVKGILKHVDLFDVYEGDQLERGKKSYAVQFIFQDDHKTLNDKQVDKAMEKIQKALETELKVILR